MGLLDWLRNLFAAPKTTGSKAKQIRYYNWDNLDPVDAYEWRDHLGNKRRKK
jgi:hypothetical protein